MFAFFLAATAFNLVCTGTADEIWVGGSTKEPYAETFRIDLDTKMWCSGDCRSPKPIKAVEPTRIVLQDEKIDTPRQFSKVSEEFNRELGIYIYNRETGISLTPSSRLSARSGRCEKREFTGFPKFETQF